MRWLTNLLAPEKALHNASLARRAEEDREVMKVRAALLNRAMDMVERGHAVKLTINNSNWIDFQAVPRENAPNIMKDANQNADRKS